MVPQFVPDTRILFREFGHQQRAPFGISYFSFLHAVHECERHHFP